MSPPAIPSFKPEQLRTLEKVKLKNLFKTLEMFVRWISDCLFDFHMLPFSVKIPLSSEVLQTLERDISTQGELSQCGNQLPEAEW